MADINKSNWLQRIKARVVQDVPSDLAICEFQCHQALCTSRQRRQCDLMKEKVSLG